MNDDGLIELPSPQQVDEMKNLRAEVARLTALLKEAQPLLYDQAETTSYFGGEPSDLYERIDAALAAGGGADERKHAPTAQQDGGDANRRLGGAV